MTRLGPFIDGASVRGSSVTTIRSPYGGEVVREVGLADDCEVEEAVRSAVRAFETTRNLSRAAFSQLLARI